MGETLDFTPTAKGSCELQVEAAKRFGHHPPLVEQFLLDHAREFEANPRPAWVEQMTPKMCFMNCFLLVDEQRSGLLGEDVPELTYCEGFVFSSGLPIPIHHAWCIQPDDTLIEPTLQQRPDETVTYFGIEVPFDLLVEIVDETTTYSVLYKRIGHEILDEHFVKGGDADAACRSEG